MSAAGLLWEAAYGLTAVYEAAGPWILAPAGVVAGLAFLAALRRLKRRRQARHAETRARLDDAAQADLDRFNTEAARWLGWPEPTDNTHPRKGGDQ